MALMPKERTINANVSAPAEISIPVDTDEIVVDGGTEGILDASAVASSVVKSSSKKRSSVAEKEDLDVLKKEGEAIYNSLDESTKKIIGSKSDTVEVTKTLLGLVNGTTKTTINKVTIDKAPKVLGFELKFHEDGKVYRFTDPSKPFRAENVKKGQVVQVTAEEAAYLAGSEEFGGRFKNAEIIVRGVSKRYTGSLNPAAGIGSLRTLGVEIDYKQEDGKLVLKDEYKEVFGFLYERKSAERPARVGAGVGPKREDTLIYTGLGFVNYIRNKKNLMSK